MVTDVPAGPDVGERPDIDGATTTVKLTPLLEVPPTFTTTFPVVVPEGTGALIEVALQLVGVAAVPLNLTVLEPWVAPKFVPVIVTTAPTPPEVGARLLMAGAMTMVNFTPLLALPLTVTTTFPVVAPEGTGTVIDEERHFVGAAAVPLNLTVLEPWLDPKPDPEIVTAVPTGPDVGERLLMLGVACAAAPNASKIRNSERQEDPCLRDTRGGSHVHRHSLHRLETPCTKTGTKMKRNSTLATTTPSRDSLSLHRDMAWIVDDDFDHSSVAADCSPYTNFFPRENIIGPAKLRVVIAPYRGGNVARI